ncbi:MAG: RNA polymerase sigma factor [Planctomycetota bacterium]|jgi:RNA polymerase sigma-70 factor (ECF subfamily)
MTEETEVIRRVLEGDIESFRLLLQRYEKPVVRMVRNITGHSDSCEDVAQDVFFTVYRRLASFDPARSSFSTWLFTIARNKSINAGKKRRLLPIGKLLEQTDFREPYDCLAQKELLNKLDAQLQALPPRQRRALVMAEFEKLPYEQIAQIEGARLGTIKSRISRAKMRLREALKDFGGDAT